MLRDPDDGAIPGLESCNNCNQLILHYEAEIEVKQAEIAALQKKIGEMARGIMIRGWWCMPCHIFNGEEKELMPNCRICNAEKPAL